MDDTPHFRGFLDRAIAAQRAVDALGAGKPQICCTHCNECRLQAAAAETARRQGLIPSPFAVDRRELLEVLRLLDESVKFGESGDARMFDTKRQARVILRRLVDGGRA